MSLCINLIKMRLNTPYIFMLNKYEPVIISIRKNNNIYETIIKTGDLYDLNINAHKTELMKAQNNRIIDEEYAPKN